MQGGIFSYALLAALATALVVAAYTDLRRRQIDNWLTAGIALTAPLYWLAAGLSLAECGIQFALALAVFVITAALFAARQMGGGDVKLLTALALWIAPLPFLKLVMMMAVIGGAASIAGAAFNLQRREGETARDTLGVGAAVVWVALSAWIAIAIIRQQPPVLPEAFTAIAGILTETWMVVAILAVLAVALLGGISHVMRRQKERLKIPYGVAISIAGLWVLASQYWPAIQSSAGA